MERISAFLVQLCQTLATTDLPRAVQAATPQSLENGVTDTTSLEIRLIERIFGGSLDSFLAAIVYPALIRSGEYIGQT